MLKFGPGFLVGIPTIDITGAAVLNPTPVQIGHIQEVSLEMSRTLKPALSQHAFPIAMGAGSGKMDGKAKNLLINGALLNLMFGQTPAIGENLVVQDEPGVVDKTAFTIVVVQAATWATDLGVRYGANGVNSGTNRDGLPLTRVPASPGPTAAGQYAVAAGTYTFYSAEASKKMLVSYLYTTTAAPGKVFTFANPLIGVAPVFQIVWNGTYAGQQGTFTLLQVMFSKLSLASKLEDWTYPEIDFSAFADVSNNLFTFSANE